MEKHEIRVPCDRMPLVGEADRETAIRPMVHCDRIADFHVLIYLIKGGMEIIEDGIAHTLTPGTLFFLKSGVHHWGEKPFLSGSAWYYVHFYMEEAGADLPFYRPQAVFGERAYLSSCAGASYIQLPKLFRPPMQKEIPKKLERLIALHNSGDMLRAGNMLWEIFADCMEENSSMENTGERDKATAVLRFLQTHYTEDFTAGQLEEAVGLSYKYAGTLFKERTGKTIKEYQIMLKVKSAATLLGTTEMTVAEIAAATGFYDAFYFSRIFKREQGMSPTAFRKGYVPRI